MKVRLLSPHKKNLWAEAENVPARLQQASVTTQFFRRLDGTLPAP
jgi:hypothetical protein